MSHQPAKSFESMRPKTFSIVDVLAEKNPIMGGNEAKEQDFQR